MSTHGQQLGLRVKKIVNLLKNEKRLSLDHALFCCKASEEIREHKRSVGRSMSCSQMLTCVLGKQLTCPSVLACGIFLRSRKKGIEKQKVHTSASRTSVLSVLKNAPVLKKFSRSEQKVYTLAYTCDVMQVS